jgi:hypothetical protein
MFLVSTEEVRPAGAPGGRAHKFAVLGATGNGEQGRRARSQLRGVAGAGYSTCECSGPLWRERVEPLGCTLGRVLSGHDGCVVRSHVVRACTLLPQQRGFALMLPLGAPAPLSTH